MTHSFPNVYITRSYKILIKILHDKQFLSAEFLCVRSDIEFLSHKIL